MLARLAPLLGSSQWCNVAAAAQHALHTSVAAAQAEAAVAQQSNVQDALNSLRKRMAQGEGKQQECGLAAATATLVLHNVGFACSLPLLQRIAGHQIQNIMQKIAYPCWSSS
jgi:hypothetical protein